jgi:hypothetical protein
MSTEQQPFFFYADTRQYVNFGSSRLPWLYGTRAALSHVLIGVLVMGLAVVGMFFLLKAWLDYRALEQEPVVVEGKVLRLWVTGGNKGRTYHVAYQYQLALEQGSGLVEQEAAVGGDYFALLAVDGPIRVTYCRSNPGNVRVPGDHRWFDNWRGIVFPSVFLVFAFCAGGAMLWDCYQARRQLHHGQMLLGSLLDCAPIANNAGANQVQVRYAFTAPDGQTVHGSSTVDPRELNLDELPQSGTSVAVLWVNGKLYRIL